MAHSYSRLSHLIIEEEFREACLAVAGRTARTLQQTHLHALFVEAVSAAKLEQEVALLDVPLAEGADVRLGHSILIQWVFICLLDKVHLLDPISGELYRRLRFGRRRCCRDFNRF